MRRFPVSVWLFGLTGLVFVLQLIPFTGIFLMFLLAPFWSVVTLNLGFVALACEAATGRVPRVWLLAPLAYFGGYAIFAHQSHQAVEQLDAAVRNLNADKHVPFDPASNALVIESNANDLGGTGSSLVRGFHLHVAYTVTRDHQRRTPKELPQLNSSYRADRVGAAATCVRIRGDTRFREATAWAHSTRPSGSARASTQPALCAYSLPERPTLPEIRISARRDPIGSWLFTGRRVLVEISMPGAETVELISGHVAPYSWLPMPIMGCALNSGAPKWQCFAGFQTAAYRGLGGTGAYGGATIEIIARALGLVPVEGPRTEPETTSTPELDELLARHETAAIANLDRLLADPTLRATVHDLKGLAERPELLIPRVDAMLSAMSAALSHGKGRSETARNLQRLLAHLPNEEFARIGPALLMALAAGTPVQPANSRRPVVEQIDGTLLRRLADLGIQAVPTFDRIVFANAGRPPVDAVLGLCRLGALASPMAIRLAQRVNENSSPRDELRLAAIVTLLRLGQPDLAEPMSDGFGGYRRTTIDAWRTTVNAESGPHVCTLRDGR